MDGITASCKRLAYTKVCFEFDLATEIPNVVKVVMRDGSLPYMLVEVPWYHHKCNHCKVFGHNDKTCIVANITKTTTEKKVWVPKVFAQNDKGKTVVAIVHTIQSLVQINISTPSKSPIANSTSKSSTKAASINKFTIPANTDLLADPPKQQIHMNDSIAVSRQLRSSSLGVVHLLNNIKQGRESDQVHHVEKEQLATKDQQTFQGQNNRKK
ncbi:hypothetical protein PTKIN_Ptkin09bG0134300 [Pterospermum kingtungense]